MTHDTGNHNSQQVCVDFPAGARALLVSMNDDGSVRATPARKGQNILNIQEDLQKHLNEYPFSDDWLVDLRDFVDAKLRARQAAKRSGGLSVPIPRGRGFAIINNFPLVTGRVEVL